MIDHETQKELLKETVEPSKALEIAIQMEMGAQNQHKKTEFDVKLKLCEFD